MDLITRIYNRQRTYLNNIFASVMHTVLYIYTHIHTYKDRYVQNLKLQRSIAFKYSSNRFAEKTIQKNNIILNGFNKL